MPVVGAILTHETRAPIGVTARAAVSAWPLLHTRQVAGAFSHLGVIHIERAISFTFRVVIAVHHALGSHTKQGTAYRADRRANGAASQADDAAGYRAGGGCAAGGRVVFFLVTHGVAVNRVWIELHVLVWVHAVAPFVRPKHLHVACRGISLALDGT
jgi:hypothetical protein